MLEGQVTQRLSGLLPHYGGGVAAGANEWTRPPPCHRYRFATRPWRQPGRPSYRDHEGGVEGPERRLCRRSKVGEVRGGCDAFPHGARLNSSASFVASSGSPVPQPTKWGDSSERTKSVTAGPALMRDSRLPTVPSDVGIRAVIIVSRPAQDGRDVFAQRSSCLRSQPRRVSPPRNASLCT